VLRLKSERLSRRWSQTKLSMLTGIASSDLSAVERGLRYAHPGWRRRLAIAFKLPEAVLFSQVDVDAEQTAK
jgi:transcriptional regulator with XRE-family HTH domain